MEEELEGSGGVNMTTKKDKVVVLGLDGATFDVMMPWIEAGRMPHIQRLMKKGCYGNLESTIHPMSPQAWTSFITGKNAGKHGIFDFTWRKPRSYEVQLTNATFREGKSLWRILSDKGKSVGVINVPMTYPPEEVNGFVISGMDAPGVNSNFTYPPEVYEEILDHFGRYIIGQRLWEFSRRGKEKDLLSALKDMIQLRTDVSLHFLKDRKPDFFMVVYRATDVVQHIFWKYYDPNHPLHPGKSDGLETAIYEVYKEVDTAVGRITKTLDDDTSVIVISDHGAGGYSDRSVYLNSWLESEGFLTYVDRPRKRGIVLNDRLEQYLLSAKGRLARHVPPKLKLDLQRMFPQLFDKVASISYFSNIDWSKTTVYSEEIRTSLWINLKGREPRGIVAPEDYETLRDELIERLKNFKDPETSEPVFAKVYKKEELYEGPFLDRAPDLVLLQGQKAYELIPRSSLNVKVRKALRTPASGEYKRDTKPSGGHRLNGILIAEGKYFKVEQEVTDNRIMDLAPTILYLMGLPVPADMDGRVMTDIFSDDFLDEYKVEYEYEECGSEDGTMERLPKGYGKEEQALIEKNLRGLGYL
jgi:predicted AlkP superfamily phosphohydrolase/phosphomutase